MEVKLKEASPVALRAILIQFKNETTPRIISVPRKTFLSVKRGYSQRERILAGYWLQAIGSYFQTHFKTSSPNSRTGSAASSMQVWGYILSCPIYTEQCEVFQQRSRIPRQN